MVMELGKHQKDKQKGQDLCWKVHDREHLLFCTDRPPMHELHNRKISIALFVWTNLITNCILPVFAYGQPQNKEQKH